jgi:hypothetical protein
MTVREFFENNISDAEGRVPVIIFQQERSNTDASLYLCVDDDGRWSLLDGKNSEWIDTQPNRELFPLVSEWLDVQFGNHLHGHELDLSECYDEIFGQLQTTGCAVDLRYSSLTSVLNNTRWELEQEGLQTQLDYTDHETSYPPPFVDVLLVFDASEGDRLSNLLESENITSQTTTSLKNALQFCENGHSSVIFLDATDLKTTEISNLGLLANLPSKLVCIVAESNLNEEYLIDLADDTYLAPMDDQKLVHCLRRHLNPITILPKAPPSSNSKPIELDVLLVYEPDASKSIQQTFDTYHISSSMVVSIQDAIDFCANALPSNILIDAKNLSKEQISSLRSLRKIIRQETKIFSCLTEASTYQNEIIALSNHIFIIPVRTSEIMKHILAGI